MRSILLSIAIFSLLLPSFAGAQTLATQPEGKPGYLIVCDGSQKETVKDVNGKEVQRTVLLPDGGTRPYNECDFKDLFKLAKRWINFLVFLTLFITSILFLYAGFQYLTSTDRSDRTEHAKKMIRKTLIAMLIIICAWIGINTVLNILGVDDEYNPLTKDPLNDQANQ